VRGFSSGPRAVEKLEDSERGVGFYGIANEMLLAGEGLGEKAKSVANMVGGVDIERRPVIYCKRVERDLAACERGLTGGGEGANWKQGSSVKE